jgi:iron complex outermembrane receptor protein
MNGKKLTSITLLIGSALGSGMAVPVFAQESGSDIIVTARRVEERLQDVPISITVLNQQEIDNRNITSPTDLATFTPALTANAAQGVNNAVFSIRGFIQDFATAPSVAVYFADVVAPRGLSANQTGDGAGPGSFFDLQNVQVLKGPQGTLFGRNTTGGAILFVPQKPKDDFSGYVEASVGNYDMKRLQAVLNVPLGEQARARIGFDRTKRDGYLKNLGVGPKNLADIDYVAARASLVVDLTPDLENYTIASYSRSDGDPPLAKALTCNPAARVGAPQVGFIPTGYMCSQQLAREAAAGFYSASNTMRDLRSLNEQWQVINTTTWKASDSLTIKNIVSYTELYNVTHIDFFGNYFVIPSAAEIAAAGLQGIIQPPANFVGTAVSVQQVSTPNGVPSTKQSSFTEEFQLQGTGIGGRLTWQAGLYYESTVPLTSFVGTQGSSFINCVDIGSLNCPSPYGTLGSATNDLRNTTYRDMAAYAQATYDITDQFRVTAGLRYTDDVSKAKAVSFIYRFLNNGTRVVTGCQNANTTLPDCRLDNLRQHSNAPTWLINFDYKPSQDVLLYAKYARGYRQGLANPRALFPNGIFGPEKVEAYEAGIKSSWHGAVPGTLNVAGFYNDFSNAQAVVAFAGPNSTQSVISSTTKARIYGVDIDGNISPFEGLQLSGGATYLNTKVTDFTAPPEPATGGPYQVVRTPVVGAVLAFSPKWKVTANAAYTLPLDDSIGRITFSGNMVYTHSFQSGSTVNSVVPGYTIYGANLNWTGVAGTPIDLSIFGTNITKKKYVTTISDVFTSLGFTSGTVGEPRVIGARVRYSF